MMTAVTVAVAVPVVLAVQVLVLAVQVLALVVQVLALAVVLAVVLAAVVLAVVLALAAVVLAAVVLAVLALVLAAVAVVLAAVVLAVVLALAAVLAAVVLAVVALAAVLALAAVAVVLALAVAVVVVVHGSPQPSSFPLKSSVEGGRLGPPSGCASLTGRSVRLRARVWGAVPPCLVGWGVVRSRARVGVGVQGSPGKHAVDSWSRRRGVPVGAPPHPLPCAPASASLTAQRLLPDGLMSPWLITHRWSSQSPRREYPRQGNGEPPLPSPPVVVDVVLLGTVVGRHGTG